MAKTRGMGLLMLWCDVDPEHEEEFNRWYDEEHIKDLMSVPGFLNGGRYEEEFHAWYDTVYIPGYLTVPGVKAVRRFVVIDGQPKYRTVYDFERADVPESEAWQRVRDSNPWTHRVRPFLRLDPGSPAVFKRIYPK